MVGSRSTWCEQSSQNGQLLRAFGVRRLVAALVVTPVSNLDYQSGDKSPHSKRPMVFGGMRSLATSSYFTNLCYRTLGANLFIGVASNSGWRRSPCGSSAARLIPDRIRADR